MITKLTLSLTDYAAISPMLILLIAALILLIIESFAENVSKKFAAIITLVSLAVALYAAIEAPTSSNLLLTSWLKFDGISRFFSILFIIVGMATTLLSDSFFQRFDGSRGEYFFLLLSSILGLIFISSSADFLTLFLGLETLSISLYVLCGYMKKWTISSEAALKYFLLGSLAAAFLLYGIALIYGAIGTTRFEGMLQAYQNLSVIQNKTLFMSGIILVTLGLAFKAAIVPFHIWAPDVYGGSPTPVTAFMAVGTKFGAFAAFVRVFLEALQQFNPLWNEGVAWLAIPTLIYANAVALRQTRLRRFFAYSGISHAGFLLIPLAVGTSEAIPALLFYLVVYGLATLGSFAVLAYLDKGESGIEIKDLYGLFYRSPYLAAILTICFLTLAGIPPTVGFFAKFYLFKLAFQADYILLVIVALLTTILSAYYYLRFVAVMFTQTPEEENAPKNSWPAYVVGTSALALIVIFSIYPAPLISFLEITTK
jgi:NADH-quinone oxidoreductase subunit N